MRIFMLCLALVIGLALATPASAQGFPPGPWRGIWTDGAGSGSEFQAELNFTMDQQGHVQGQFRWMLVQSPRHEDTLASMDERAVEQVLSAAAARVQDLKRDRRFRYVIIFKNHGAAAGAAALG